MQLNRAGSGCELFSDQIKHCACLKIIEKAKEYLALRKEIEFQQCCYIVVDRVVTYMDKCFTKRL